MAWLPAGFLAVVFSLLAALLLLPRPWNWAGLALNAASLLLPLRTPPPQWASRFLRFSIAESRCCECGLALACCAAVLLVPGRKAAAWSAGVRQLTAASCRAAHRTSIAAHHVRHPTLLAASSLPIMAAPSLFQTTP